VKIVNKRSYRGNGVYIGRPSPLGNPFVIGKDGTRDQVIEKYRHWLYGKMTKPGIIGDAKIMRALAALNEDSVLICWCAPRACHGSVVEDAWRWLRTEGLV